MNARVYSYYIKKAYGGRTVFARFIDFMMLRALLLVGLFLLFLHLSKSLTTALLVSIFLTLAVSITLFKVKTKKIEKYIKKDIEDLKRKCLLETLTLMDSDEFADYMCKLFDGLFILSRNNSGFSARKDDERIFVLHNHPSINCDIDYVLKILRNNKDKKITIVSLSEFTDSVKTLCKYERHDVTLINGQEVLALAAKADMMPNEQTAQRKAEEEMNDNIITISKITEAALRHTKVKAYIFCGIAAVFWPFVTGFRFYYPVIAVVCFILAILTQRKSRNSGDSVSA